MPETFDPEDLPNVIPFQRVLGYLYVTEHRNYGELQLDSPIEPAMRTTKHTIAGEPVEVDRETRCVALFSTFRCRVAFVPAGDDVKDAEAHAFPLAPETEVTRTLHPNTAMRIVTFPDY